MPAPRGFIDRFAHDGRVRLWTVIGGIASTLGLIVAIVALLAGNSGAPSSNSPQAAGPDVTQRGPTTAASTVPTSSPGATIDAPGTSSTTSTSPGSTGPRTLFVADLDAANVVSNNSYQTGGAELAGRTYSRSALPSCLYDQRTTEFNLSKQWTSFAAALGIKDQSSSEYTAFVTVYLDDSLWNRPLTVKVGSPVQVNINVTGVLKLKIVCSPGAGQQGFIRLALGDALLSAPR
jgi:hypothetical protein